MSSFLDLYDPLDIIGNGSFGIIRKVRRKSDGLIFARKELNFERMSERDRKQIVAEVNILKDLHHDHIVRYHDRYVDRDAGILYILMEYCGGGDLSTVIKQAQKSNRPIPEDTVWNYFMQILRALHNCHHPNGHGRSSSCSGNTGGGGLDADGKDRRAQILHRDLKPDNVFLDEANNVKLGDFGLSKALAQASFANTYVGTPYYMSPELMQEKAYDSKSDIWSLGCLIYELCALKPPFHEAKTHAELSIFIRNGRIPPLPRGYSQSLAGVIKAMLNLNPAMRPSTAQLLQHERLELVFKVSETEKMLSTVKTHKVTIAAKEREVLAREASLHEKETHIAALLFQKDRDIAALQQQLSEFEQKSHHSVEQRICEAIASREEELRVAIMRREEEVASAIARREEEIMEAVRKREEELYAACMAREKQMAEAFDERVAWVEKREEELKEEAHSLEVVRSDLEMQIKTLADEGHKFVRKAGRKDKMPLEEVKNLLARVTESTPSQSRIQERVALDTEFPGPQETPVGRNVMKFPEYIPSAMKGVVLTATGEALATPTPAELANLFVNSPRVGLNFAKIFDFDDEVAAEDSVVDSPPPSPSKRERRKIDTALSSGSTASTSSGGEPSSVSIPPTRLRRPSIRTSIRHPPLNKASTAPIPTAIATGPSTSSDTSQAPPTASKPPILPLAQAQPAPVYDFTDEENLPSPFLKRIDKDRVHAPLPPAKGSIVNRRTSNGNMLRAVAAANSANIHNQGSTRKRTLASTLGSKVPLSAVT